MNEQLRQRAQEIADEHDNDAYSVALYLVGRENEIRGLKKQLHDEIAAVKRHERKIKAEAVRDCVTVIDEMESPEASDFLEYANKLENQND